MEVLNFANRQSRRPRYHSMTWLNLMLTAIVISAGGVTLTSASLASASPLVVGAIPSTIVLDGPLGAHVDGTAWTSDSIAKTGKVVSLFYVDPEEKKLNEEVEVAYDNMHFSKEKHASIAVINMAAAWYPNSLINRDLAAKQIKFPRTTYVKDLKKSLVKEWDLQDDSVNIVVFGKDGKVIFIKKGPMSTSEIAPLLALISANL
jgi:uncharacterized protein